MGARHAEIDERGQLPDDAQCLLAELVARRRQIVEMIVAEGQREKRAANVRIRKGIVRHIKMLEKELPTIDEGIGTLVRGLPVWREKEHLMVFFPRIAQRLARSILAEVPEIGSPSRRQIASLAGIAPFTRQSGRWKGRSMIGGGRAPARAALFMAALVASRHNAVLKEFYACLLAGP